MPSRIVPFVNGQIYHIYNRGSDKRIIFNNRLAYKRFLSVLCYYQIEGPKPKFSNFSKIHQIDKSKRIVEILVYCLMPNHFHLLLLQTKDGGITEFISKVSNSYTKYYNTKHERVGPLLQGEFKSVIMEDDDQLVHVSRYIHLNPLVSALVNNLDDYEWSSYNEYILESNNICLKDTVLGHFKSVREYRQFVLDQADYAKKLELIKHKSFD